MSVAYAVCRVYETAFNVEESKIIALRVCFAGKIYYFTLVIFC